MRRLVDRAAEEAGLAALDVPGRGPLPTGAPRTA
jgi:hypothetical protein